MIKSSFILYKKRKKKFIILMIKVYMQWLYILLCSLMYNFRFIWLFICIYLVLMCVYLLLWCFFMFKIVLMYMYLLLWCFFMVKNRWLFICIYLVLMHMYIFLWCFFMVKNCHKFSKSGTQGNGWYFFAWDFRVNAYVYIPMVLFYG